MVSKKWRNVKDCKNKDTTATGEQNPTPTSAL